MPTHILGLNVVGTLALVRWGFYVAIAYQSFKFFTGN